MNITATLYGIEKASNFPGDAERAAAYLLRDRSNITSSADAWHMLRSAESYCWKRYNEVTKEHRARVLAATGIDISG